MNGVPYYVVSERLNEIMPEVQSHIHRKLSYLFDNATVKIERVRDNSSQPYSPTWGMSATYTFNLEWQHRGVLYGYGATFTELALTNGAINHVAGSLVENAIHDFITKALRGCGSPDFDLRLKEVCSEQV